MTSPWPSQNCIPVSIRRFSRFDVRIWRETDLRPMPCRPLDRVLVNMGTLN